MLFLCTHQDKPPMVEIRTYRATSYQGFFYGDWTSSAQPGGSTKTGYNNVTGTYKMSASQGGHHKITYIPSEKDESWTFDSEMLWVLLLKIIILLE